MPIRFMVEEVFHLTQREVTIASGRLMSGMISGPVILMEEGTGRSVTVLGVELLPPQPTVPKRTSLIIERSSNATALTKGAMLTGPG